MLEISCCIPDFPSQPLNISFIAGASGPHLPGVNTKRKPRRSGAVGFLFVGRHEGAGTASPFRGDYRPGRVSQQARRRRPDRRQPPASSTTCAFSGSASVDESMRTHIIKTHPHAEAAYRVLAHEDGSFGVEVVIPDTHPTKVGPFETQSEAEGWVERQRDRVLSQSAAGTGFGKRRFFRK
jgi:hypothetical protein